VLNIAASCGTANNGPEHWVEDTAIYALNAWVQSGQLPATGALLTLATAGNGYAKDSNGNTLGGVRSPAVDVPIAAYSGQPSSASAGNILCSFFGQTTPFTTAQLMTLYPTHNDYVSKVTAAATMDQQAGFLLTADVPLIEQEAQAAPVPQ
jgi:hypothetical protein